MSKHLGDFRNGGTVADHPGRQAVAKQVGGVPTPRRDAGTAESQPDDVVAGTRPREADPRRDEAPERASGRGGAPVVAQILGHRPAHIGEKRKMVHPRSLAANNKLARTPPQIIKLERDHLARTHAQAGEQQENGVVTATPGGRSIRTRQYLLDFLGRQQRRHARPALSTYRRGPRPEIPRWF